MRQPEHVIAGGALLRHEATPCINQQLRRLTGQVHTYIGDLFVVCCILVLTYVGRSATHAVD